MQTVTKHRLFNSAYLIIFVAGIGFFILSFMLLGVLPGTQLRKVIEARAPANKNEGALYMPAKGAVIVILNKYDS